MTLAEWLLACIAEDEAESRESLGGAENQRWAIEDAGDLNEGFIVSLLRERLAECAAKRSIVELHRGDHGCPDASGMDTYTWVGAPRNANCQTLRLLALPLADRPGYRPEWAPE